MNTHADLLKELRIDRKAPSAPEPGQQRGKLIALAAGVVLILLALAAWLLLGRDKPVPVQTASATALGQGNAQASVLDASGYVVARRMATVSAQITGRVKEVLIEEGMQVEAGQVMATLDTIDANAQRQLYASQTSAARSQVDSVRAQLAEAENNAKRMSSLVQQQLVSRAQYEQAIATRDSLRAQLTTTQRNAQVAADQLHVSDINLGHTVVRAPFGGVVIAKAAQPGEIVSPMATGGYTRTGIGTIVDMDSLEVEVDVGEAYIGRVQPKMPVEATLNSYPDWKIPAEVIAIIPTADRGKATVKVRVALKEKDARIVPDMGVTVSFLEKAPEPDAGPRRGVRIPAAAIIRHDGSDAVFVVSNTNVAEQRKVETGGTLGSDREVVSGLAPGETVIVAPPAGLADGAAVSTNQN